MNQSENSLSKLSWLPSEAVMANITTSLSLQAEPVFFFKRFASFLIRLISSSLNCIVLYAITRVYQRLNTKSSDTLLNTPKPTNNNQRRNHGR